MEMERFEQLLAAYGASFQRWPAEERDAAQILLQSSEEARRLHAQTAALDRMLDAWQVEPPDDLRERILAQLPRTVRTPLDRFVDWLMPDMEHMGAQVWRPALVAAIPLLVGIILGSTLDIVSDGTDSPEVWQEEIYLMALNEPESAP